MAASARWIAAELRAGRAVWLEQRGLSMAPSLAPGDRLLVVPLDGAPRVGEIVVAERGGRLVAHRLLALDGAQAVTRGDGCADEDPPIAAAELLGRAVRVERSPLRALWRRLVDGDAAPEAPLLEERAVIAAARAGRLPPRFRCQLRCALLPFVDGAIVLASAGAPPAGAVACVVDGERLAWRRALAVRGASALLRGDVAPFADGWHQPIAHLAPRGPVEAVAARWPRQWTSAGWSAALAWSRARAALPRPRRRGGFTVAVAPRPDGFALALRDDDGAQAGRASVILDGASAELCELEVAPPYRGRGGGTQLARAAVDEAARRGVRRVTSWVAARNAASRAAHLGAGFRPTGRFWRSDERPLLAAERQLVQHAVEIRHPSW
jgi:GNAT superfamily N-acetyltransferase